MGPPLPIWAVESPGVVDMQRLSVGGPARFPVPPSRASQGLAERLFLLMTLGDDRAVAATYVAGRRVHERKELFAGSRAN